MKYIVSLIVIASIVMICCCCVSDEGKKQAHDIEPLLNTETFQDTIELAPIIEGVLVEPIVIETEEMLEVLEVEPILEVLPQPADDADTNTQDPNDSLLTE